MDNQRHTYTVRVIDCDATGFIGAPYAVYVIRDDGKVCSSTSGIQSLNRAHGIAAEYRASYRVGVQS